ncbi:MAG: helix-turn-helix transcriptional regulator [Spirochaetaceae bacterium]|nr:helix-turn-helix transcriptional regulator [Spirochaetaceae bacterium]
MSLRNIFIENLKFYRKNSHFSQQQLAERCNIATNYLSEIERGVKFPSVEMIERFSQALSVPAYLFFIDSSESTLNTDKLTKKRNEEFSKNLLQNIRELLKTYGFLD